MPVISQGCPELIFFNMLNTDSGLFHLLTQLPQFHFFANSLKIEKSDRAMPGAGRTFLICPIRRSELINVPSFSAQPDAGKKRSASSAVSVVE